MSTHIILGAGLAGCFAGHLFPGSSIYEAKDDATVLGAHHALLRFRSDEVSKIVGIPFRRVRVHKEVYDAAPSHVANMNDYSRKVSGALGDRSLSDLSPVDRWIAPPNLHQQMAERLDIHWNWPVVEASRMVMWTNNMTKGIDRLDIPVISTIPLPALLTLLEVSYTPRMFERKRIHVQRAVIEGADVFQTVYFPDLALNVYRASITGNLLIIESMDMLEAKDWGAVYDAFSITEKDLLVETVSVVQEFGKILPLQKEERRALLHRITDEYNIYSFGRFACWRNVLMDDLVQDADRIRGLIRMSTYERKMEISK